jgi:GT2 family glycosyltransferase
MEPKVVVVILNFNGTADTMECVESVRQLEYSNFEILLVDNASSDTAWRRIKEKFPDIRVLENPGNLGYAGGNNAGIRVALREKCDYVFILNNDTVIAKDALRRLVAVSAADTALTIAAPKILYYDRCSVIDSCGTRMDWLRLRPKPGFHGRTDQPGQRTGAYGVIFPGSALLLKTRFFDEVGLFDEDYFLIHEDADLCLRNLRHGLKNVLVEDAVVYHKVSRVLSRDIFLQAYYDSRNFLLLARRQQSSRIWALVIAGLFPLMIKKAWTLATGDFEQKKKSRGFFKGISDYFKGRRGRYG